VVADRFATTSDARIFTAGDVAVTHDPVTGEKVNTGLWTNAVEMGRCAGWNMAGRKTAYAGTFGIMNATQIANEPFVSMGIVHTRGTDYETHISSGSDFYRKIVFSPDGSRLAGVVLSGDITGAGLLRLVMRQRMPVSAFKGEIIRGRLNYGHFVP
jgi:NADPH-dependent 2,4-dienoyl-CoA reductase/sulfur reductase-like enzyme